MMVENWKVEEKKINIKVSKFFFFFSFLIGNSSSRLENRYIWSCCWKKRSSLVPPRNWYSTKRTNTRFRAKKISLRGAKDILIANHLYLSLSLRLSITLSYLRVFHLLSNFIFITVLRKIHQVARFLFYSANRSNAQLSPF